MLCQKTFMATANSVGQVTRHSRRLVKKLRSCEPASIVEEELSTPSKKGSSERCEDSLASAQDVVPSKSQRLLTGIFAKAQPRPEGGPSYLLGGLGRSPKLKRVSAAAGSREDDGDAVGRHRSATEAGEQDTSNVRVPGQRKKRGGRKPAVDIACTEDAEDVKKPKHRNKGGPTRELEAALWQKGFKHIAGVDEAGRGPLAGPVVAAACILPKNVEIEGIDDSKKLTEERREELFAAITSTPGVVYAVEVVSPSVIDSINILQATMRAMASSVHQLGKQPGGVSADYVLVDGNRVPEGLMPGCAEAVVKGDAKSIAIAAASIVAKVTRDRMMHEYDKQWPMYGFKDHKGYGTANHVAAILKHGPCDIHRRSFAPIKDWDFATDRT